MSARARAVRPLYDRTVRCPALDRNGDPMFYLSGQPMMVQLRVKIGPVHRLPVTDDLVLSVGPAAGSQSALLSFAQVRQLAISITAGSSLVLGPSPDGTYVEHLPRPEGVSELAVVGYGHAWKRRAVVLGRGDWGPLVEALSDWVDDGGWTGNAT